jgi:hypothetical protein
MTHFTDYYIVEHRKWGTKLARRVVITNNPKTPLFYIWHEADGKQRSARHGSAQLVTVVPVTVSAREIF